MEQGWTIDGREQMMLHHDALEEIKVPVEMQKRSVTVMGCIRVVQQTPHPIRMMTARLDDSLQNLNHGWTTSEKDMVIGYHISDQFLEPMQLHGKNRMRTTLVQSADGGWSIVESWSQVRARQAQECFDFARCHQERYVQHYDRLINQPFLQQKLLDN